MNANLITNAAIELGLSPIACLQAFMMTRQQFGNSEERFVQALKILNGKYNDLKNWAEGAPLKEVVRTMTDITLSIQLLPWTSDGILKAMESMKILVAEVESKSKANLEDDRQARFN